MAKLIYCIGTKTKMNVGAYIFDQTMRHGKSEATKLPIAFPTLLCNIILQQQPSILIAADVPKKRESPISLHYKLFGKSHAADIAGTSASVAPTDPAVVGHMTRKDILVALKDTCRFLEERKTLFERLIVSLENGEANAGAENLGAGEGVDEEEEADT
jgi:hypothetical protein